MRVLLDTQAFLWYSAGDSRLSGHSRSLIEDGGNERFLSTASLFEIAIKLSINKLTLTDPFDQFANEAMERLKCSVLNISNQHLARLATLPLIRSTG